MALPRRPEQRLPVVRCRPASEPCVVMRRQPEPGAHRSANKGESVSLDGQQLVATINGEPTTKRAPVEAPVEFMVANEVIERTKLSRTTIWRLIKSGSFPKPSKLGKTRLIWRTAAVEAWIRAL